MYFTLKSRRRLTKRAMVFAAVRVLAVDRERWYAASKLLGISQSEFLRLALRERSARVLSELAK